MAGFFKRIFSKEKKEKLDEGLQKTKQGVWDKITRAVAGKSKVDDEVLDNLEEAFITSDVGVDTTIKIIDRLKERVAKDKYVNTNELNNLLCDEIIDMIGASGVGDEDGTLDDFQVKNTGVPHVILVVGVNGVGKTTTIGKLAYQYKKAGNHVILGAADTFRAASIPQLCAWGERAGVEVIKQDAGSDPASVAYDTVASAKAKGADVVIIDTSGRLHNQVGLMNELSKVRRVISRVIPEAPQETLLVLDGATGQNGFEQARRFIDAAGVDCMAVTKLDGTAKGGVVIGISDQLKIPVKYIGIGEKMDDLQVFRPKEFVRSLFLNEENK
ncbi:MAG: signal recognition particle-docking protein FtsY [Bacteroidales bacterium]|nr:signal recognition particle-docking protein FtsY [Bacteroidales bacterium]MBD5218364.1 signal recognition particle-docking protein FtsY [Bacteroidales bacterium]MBD5221568.1 signal recognition particle-docking protein FtsY [Bacteroidales bacterium]